MLSSGGTTVRNIHDKQIVVLPVDFIYAVTIERIADLKKQSSFMSHDVSDKAFEDWGDYNLHASIQQNCISHRHGAVIELACYSYSLSFQ
jgi:hypothetical protein